MTAPTRLLSAAAAVLLGLTSWAASPKAKPDVTVINAGPTGLAVTSRSPALHLRIQLQANQAGASGLSVVVGDLRSESGQYQQVDYGNVKPDRLRPFAVATVEVRAPLPELGSYSSTILVTHDRLREPAVPLTVTRTNGAPSVEASGPGTGELVEPSRDPAAVVLTVTESVGGQVTLAPPTLVDLGRVEGDVTLQPQETRVEVQSRDAGATDWTPVTGDGLTVSSGKPKEVRFELPGAHTPGTYTATAKFREPGGASLDKPVKVFVRYPLWLLLAGVAAGLLLSAGMRFFVAQARLRAAMRRRLSQVLVDLDQAVEQGPVADDPPVDELVRALLATQHGLAELVGRRGPVPAEAVGRLDRMERRAAVAPLWIRLHRLVAGVQPPSLLSEERGTLRDLRQPLMSEDTSVEELGKTADKLAALERAIAARLVEELTRRLDQLTLQVDEEGFFLPETVRVGLAGVRGQLEVASRRLRVDDYVAASEALTSAQDSLVNLLLLDLDAYARHLPPWVDDQSIGEAVIQELRRAGAPARRYHDALHTLLDRLITHAEGKAGLVPAGSVEDYNKALARARAALEADRPQEARDELTRAVELAKGFRGGKAYRDAAAVRTDRAVPAGVLLPAQVVVPPLTDLRARAVAARADLAAVAKRERFLSIVSLLVAAVVALTLAAVILYSRVWGSWKDLAIAVLWGLGIHAGTGYTFTGLDQLRTELTAPPATAA